MQREEVVQKDLLESEIQLKDGARKVSRETKSTINVMHYLP